MGFPPTPPVIKSVSHFLKIADEHDQRNIVISYWCRMYAVQHAMKIITGPKPPEVSNLLVALMDWLEKTKQEQKDNEGILNETCAQAIIEEYAIKLLDFAEVQDRAEKFEKNMIKAFYTSGILFDTLDQFGPLSDDIEEKRKYAKWRAAYIHGCLKEGQRPSPGCNTILYTEEDERNFKDFVSQEDLDKMKGRTPSDVPAQPSKPITYAWPPKGSAEVPTEPDETPPPAPEPKTLPTPSTPVAPVTPAIPTTSTSAVSLTAEQTEKVQKYCKWAGSALTYNDTNNAIENLQKALKLLQFGKE